MVHTHGTDASGRRSGRANWKRFSRFDLPLSLADQAGMTDRKLTSRLPDLDHQENPSSSDEMDYDH